MKISDIKKLWGLSAGRCSRPGCNVNCADYLESDDIVVSVGEMAHIIDEKPYGKRSEDVGGADTYENHILLCPTHHKLIDKSPKGTFPEDLLRKWKKDHEDKVKSMFKSPIFDNKKSMFSEIESILIQNKSIHKQYSPDSETAKKNPLSNSANIWFKEKLEKIVPNNRRIINIIEQNNCHLSSSEYSICCSFMNHAEGFEVNCFEKTEDVPKFPIEFEELIKNYEEK